jgi:predicted nucleic acid-binding protein
VLGLAGHAAFETFSVLTRLPPPNRLTGSAVTRLLLDNFPETRFLSSARAAELFADLAAQRLAGGAVYDALVAATAREHGLTLVSRDQRALNTYRRIGVDLHLLP